MNKKTSEQFNQMHDMFSQAMSIGSKQSDFEQNSETASSLFESEDMDRAFRDFYSQLSTDEMSRSFDEEINEIKRHIKKGKVVEKKCGNKAKQAQKCCALGSRRKDSSDTPSLTTSESVRDDLNSSLFESDNMEAFQEYLSQLKPKGTLLSYENDFNILLKMEKDVKKNYRFDTHEFNEIVEVDKEVKENCNNVPLIKNKEINDELQGAIRKSARLKKRQQKLVENNVDIEKNNNDPYQESLNIKRKVDKKTENSLVAKKKKKPQKSFEERANNRAPTPLPTNLPKKEQMIWLRNKRNVGLWAMCDKCKKYRYLKDTTDPLDLPDKWYCYMNPDRSRNSCSQPEEKIPIAQKQQLIRNKYHAGSIVYAKYKSYPWWPAMVQDDPEHLTYFLLKKTDIPTHYHVSFFCLTGLRSAWIHVSKLKGFKNFFEDELHKVNRLKPKEVAIYGLQIKKAKNEAKEALKLTTIDRLYKYALEC